MVHLEKRDSEDDLDNENDDSDEEEVYLGPPPLIFTLYVDKVSSKIFHRNCFHAKTKEV